MRIACPVIGAGIRPALPSRNEGCGTQGRYLFLFAVCVSLALSSGQAYAQRYLPRMKGVELRGGFAGNLKSPVDWYTGFAVSGYTKRANHWVAGVEYLLKNYGYRGTSVPRAQFTAEGGYYLKFLSDPAKIFFLSVGGSALVTGEKGYCMTGRDFMTVMPSSMAEP